MSAEAHGGGEASGTVPVQGRVDRAGRLIAADPPLAALHAAAGGAPGGMLAVPSLAALADLARRLGVAVARALVAADADHDIHLEARAWPEDDQVRIVLDKWEARPSYLPPLAADAVRAQDFLRATADWSWEVDEALRLTALSGAPASAACLVGASLTSLLRLIPDDEGGLPILDALGEQRAFAGQRGTIVDGGTEYRLAAEPLFDSRGRFRGFRGTAEAVDGDGADKVVAGFGARIDRALRGALDSVIGGAAAIHAQADGPLRREYADYAADIAIAGRHLLGLLDDLVDIEAVERGDFRVEIRPIDLADVARRAAALLGAPAKARGIRIDCPAEEEQVDAVGDYRRTLQIVVNLLSNAVRYAPENSAVWLRAERTAELAALVVADQGRGIAAADQARIFDKFDRLGSDEPGGAGLGLYIARRLARAMAGDIAVDSAPGSGARFTLTLPGT